MVRLPSMPAGGPTTMTIKGDSDTITLKNVLIGEVWICSGQSNMQWPLEKTTNAQEAISAATNEKIRLFTVPRQTTVEPQTEVDGSWVTCTPESVRHFSAVGYYFGKALEAALGVPVGLINTSYGGTPAEAWTSKETLANDPALAPTLEYVKDVKNAHRATGLYNAMIAPLVPYAIAGAIWYQGESNAGRAYEYQQLFPAMIQDWRAAWGQGDFPFFLVQLAPFMKIQENPGDSAWAELREAQRLSTHRLPNVGMAVITDVGEQDDIHPQRKAPVGERLALAARAIAYGEDITYSGPELQSLRIDGDKAIVKFDNVGKGLVAKDGPLTGFTIAGADGKFHKAEAEINKDEVIVSAKAVPHPVAVRFGWADFPVVNLWNADGLPASPFRTDHFPMVTRPGRK
jgi:sialate O-acetylesterase